MKKIIYIILFLGFQYTISQDIKIITDIPKHLNPQTIVDNYIKSIGGENKIKKIKTIKKIFNIEIDKVSDFKIEGEIVYKRPNLYSSTLTIEQLGQIQSTKYDGVNCILKRFQDNKISEKKIEGKELKEKLKDFSPFPILEAKNQNTNFQLIEIQLINKQKIYKIHMNNNENDTTYLFFDSKTKHLIKKINTNKRTEITTNYEDFREIEGIMFPFLEISTTKIDNHIAQKSINRINEISINQEIKIDAFK